VVRKDAWQKATGEAKYADDIPVENLYYGAILRSTYHHALINRLDTTNAKKIDGVIAVITANEIPGERTFGPLVQDRPVLASGKIRYKGEPVALVVAESKNVARRVLNEIKVNYKKLPPVHDPINALQPNATQVHENGNLLREIIVEKGNIQRGFDEADIIVRETFNVPSISPAYLEPEVATAVWQDNGSIKLWLSTQIPLKDQQEISRVLAMPMDKISLTIPFIGGSFGGRQDSGLAVLAALGARLTQGAVRLINSRQESFLTHPKRHSAVLKYKIGAKSNGRIVAFDLDAVLDTGAYASFGPAIGAVFTEMAAGPYRIPNLRVVTKVAYTNNLFSGAVRGFAGPQASFGCESIINILAARLECGPIEIRRINAWRKGDFTSTDILLHEEPSLRKCLDRAEKASERLRKIIPSKGKLSGVGVATSFLKMGLGYGIQDESTNRIELLPDGRALLRLGSPDLGQGLITVAAQIAAEGLDLDYKSIEVADIDTSVFPKVGMTCTSRTTFLVGNSVLKASEKTIDSLINYAAEDLGIPRDLLVYKHGRIYRMNTNDTAGLPISIFISRAAESGQVLAGEATITFPHPPDTPTKFPHGMPHTMFCYGAQAVRVEVDPDLGIVEVKDVVAIHDVGKAINPVCVEGQIEGAVVMGVGYAILEEMKLKGDSTWIDNFSEYLLPTILDAPSITSIILEQEEPSGPFGAKGIGEPAIVAVAPAIADAVYNATGKRITSIPIRSEDLLDD
jgi:CO/xanthine dehydrogenase Mo-binding subunit